MNALKTSSLKPAKWMLWPTKHHFTFSLKAKQNFSTLMQTYPWESLELFRTSLFWTNIKMIFRNSFEILKVFLWNQVLVNNQIFFQIASSLRKTQIKHLETWSNWGVIWQTHNRVNSMIPWKRQGKAGNLEIKPVDIVPFKWSRSQDMTQVS